MFIVHISPFTVVQSSGIFLLLNNKTLNKKSELMLMIRARAYSSSCLQVILVYFHPFRRSSLFCSQNSPKITKNYDF